MHNRHVSTTRVARRRVRRPSVIVVAAMAATLAMITVGAMPATAGAAAARSSGSPRAGGIAAGPVDPGAIHWPTTTDSVDTALTAAAAKGPVPVIAELSDFAVPSGASTTAEVSAHRSMTEAASSRLAAGLPRGSVSRVQALGSEPLVAMTVDAKGLAALRAQPDVIRVSPNRPNKISVTYSQNLNRVGAPTAWAAGDTGSGQTVAIVDTGVDGTNAFLSGKVVAQGCFTSAQDAGVSTSVPICPGGDPTTNTSAGAGVPCPDLTDGCYHGTHVAGIAAGGAAGVGPMAGVAPGAKIIAVDVFSQVNNATDCGGPSSCIVAWDSDVIRGLDYVYSLRNSFSISSVNMSLGGPGSINADLHCDGDPQKPAIDQLRAAGIATVVASGNDGADEIDAPACISTAIAVGSVKADTEQVSGFSNISPALTIYAPGESGAAGGIISSVPTGTPGAAACPAPYAASSCASLEGTSMATPHVTGALAVLRQAKPGMAVSLEIDQLQNTGNDITEPVTGLIEPSLREGSAVTQVKPASFSGGVSANKDGRLEVFRGGPGGITHEWQVKPNSTWSGFRPLGGPIHGAPIAVTNFDGRLEVFGVASGQVWHAWQTTPGGAWSGWNDLGGALQNGQLTIFMNPDGRLEMFALQNNAVVHQWQTTPGGAWSGWRNAGLTGVPNGVEGISSMRSPDGQAIVQFVDGVGDWLVQIQVTPGGTWSDWGEPNAPPLPAAVGTPTAAVNQNGAIDLFTSDDSGELWHTEETFSEGQFNNEVAIVSGFPAGNLAIGRNGDGRLEIFDDRPGGTVVHAWQVSPNGSWSGANLLPSTIGSVPAPLQNTSDLDGRLELFAPQGGEHNWQVAQNGPWSGWRFL